MPEVIVSPQAEADLLKLSTRIASAAGAETAERFIDKIVVIVRKLAAVPRAAGHPVPQLGRGLRCHAIGKYNAYIRFDDKSDILYLVRVLHGRRNIQRKHFS